MTKGLLHNAHVYQNILTFIYKYFFQSGLPPNWWQLSEEQTDTNFKLDTYFNGAEGGRLNEDTNDAEMNANGNGQYLNRIGTIPTHI